MDTIKSYVKLKGIVAHTSECKFLIKKLVVVSVCCVVEHHSHFNGQRELKQNVAILFLNCAIHSLLHDSSEYF